MSEKPMSSDIMMMMFGGDCAATVARPASPPCATARGNSKLANAFLMIMHFIVMKPPVANVGQEKWCARVLAGRDFAFHDLRKKRRYRVLAGRDFALQAFRKTRFISSPQSTSCQTLPARTRWSLLFSSIRLPPNPAREDAGAPTQGRRLYPGAISLLLLFSCASMRCSTASLQVACRAWP